MQIFHKTIQRTRGVRAFKTLHFNSFMHKDLRNVWWYVIVSYVRKVCTMHHYMQQYAIIQKDCIYLTWIHFWNWNCFCKNIVGLPSSGPCIEKRIKKFFLQEWYQFKKCAARIKAMLRKPAKDGFIMQAFSGQRFHI